MWCAQPTPSLGCGWWTGDSPACKEHLAGPLQLCSCHSLDGAICVGVSGGGTRTSGSQASYRSVPQLPQTASPSGGHVLDTHRGWGLGLRPLKSPWFTQLTSQLLLFFTVCSHRQ